jgi:hypothetical protein
MKIIIRNVKYISKTTKIIMNKRIIRLNPFEVKIIVIDVENFDFLNFKDQALPEPISGIIFNIFDVEHKIKTIFNTR